MPRYLAFSLPTLLALTLGAPCFAQAQVQAPARGKTSGLLPLYFARRPAMDGSGRMSEPVSAAPVLVELTSPPTASDVRTLESFGMRVQLRRDGTPRGFANYLVASASPAAIAAAAASPRVRRVELDGSPFDSPPPLEGTAKEVQAADAWRTMTDDGVPLAGAGVVICDIDWGIDPFHPLFFRADGGLFDWVDLDGDGVLTPGVDGIDLDGDGDGVLLDVLDVPVLDRGSEVPIFGTGDPGFTVGADFLFADDNGNGERDYGPSAGFTEQHPTYGERLFVVDDVDRDGVVDVGEKLIALGTSKIRAVRYEDAVYRRGEDLIALNMVGDNRADIGHGTASSGVLLGGVPGLTRLVGMAPDAELVLAFHRSVEEVANIDFCVEEGARVVLHEYAPWIARPLDGSSPTEALIDETSAQGVVHINPAGNLSGAKKLYKGTVAAGQTSIVPISAPSNSGYGAFRVMNVSLLWREPSRDPTFTLEAPNGDSTVVAVPGPDMPVETPWGPGLTLYALRTDSSRGTARLDISLFSADGTATVPYGAWKLHVADHATAGSPDLGLVAYASDDRSGWGVGVHFTDGVSEDHLIGAPGTADHGLVVAAYTGHGWDGDKPGERAPYSGRGRRIDDAELMWIAAPADPATAGFSYQWRAAYRLFGGTSGASAHVAGAAALLIQQDPSRSAEDVRAAIRDGALVDEQVGDAPNRDFGHGKLRIYESLFGQTPAGGTRPEIVIAPHKVAAGEPAAVPIEVSDPDEPADELVIEVDRDYDGQFEEQLAAAQLPVHFAEDEVGEMYVYKVRVTDSTGRTASTFARIEVVEATPDMPDMSEPTEGGLPEMPADDLPETMDDASDGCAGGCAVPGGDRGPGAIAPLALVLLAATRRRRVDA